VGGVFGTRYDAPIDLDGDGPLAEPEVIEQLANREPLGDVARAPIDSSELIGKRQARGSAEPSDWLGEAGAQIATERAGDD